MIIKASQRSGAKQLGEHLLKTEENEHVEIHEVSGFVSEDVHGAMAEAYALSLGTRCKQYLFSVSLNPPIGENVGIEVFENAIKMIEERNGLLGQPRVMVLHEKEGRRHMHAVWCRIDAETMTAKPLPFFKKRLNDIAHQLFIENRWELPKGFIDTKLRDPRSFTLDEWQKSKRAGLDPRALKEAVQEAWASADNALSFAAALEERGLFLARGDRRGHVVVTISGDVYAVSRMVDLKAKEVAGRLGDPAQLPSVSNTTERLGDEMGARLRGYIAEAKRIATDAMKPLLNQRQDLKERHQSERQRLDAGQRERFLREQNERSARMRKGAMGVWDFVTGRYAKLRAQNELESAQALRRDRAQRDNLVSDQLKERSELQHEIQQLRERHARQVLALCRDAVSFRRRADGLDKGRDAEADLGR